MSDKRPPSDIRGDRDRPAISPAARPTQHGPIRTDGGSGAAADDDSRDRFGPDFEPFNVDLESLSTPDLLQRAQAAPLAHPLYSSLVLHDYEYLPPPHIQELYGAGYRALSDHPAHTNAPKNLLRLYPREHGKSEAVSHVYPVWAALNNPNVRILLISQSQKQATNKLGLCRQTIRKYASRFGRQITRDTNRELTLDRTQNHDVATISAAGFGTSITGGHFDIIILDDLVDYSNQRTETRRETVTAEFQNYLNLGTEGKTVFFIIGTRKHPHDLYSRLIESPTWDTIVKQAIEDFSVVENGRYQVVTEHNRRFDSIQDVPIGETVTGVEVDPEVREQVGVLWPERWPLEKLIYDYLTASTRGEGSLVWRRENLNDAQALVGQILTEDMLVWTDELPKDDDQYRFFAGLDIALVDDPEKAATGDTDYWALATIAHDPTDDVTYLVDIRRRRGMTMREGIKWARKNLRDFNINRILVESNQAQRWLVEEARDDGLRWERSKSTGKKAERILSMSSRFESGKVRICDGHVDGPPERWDAFVSEWGEFSGDEDSHRHDDMLDSCEVALRNLSKERVSQTHGFGDLPLG